MTSRSISRGFRAREDSSARLKEYAALQMKRVIAFVALVLCAGCSLSSSVDANDARAQPRPLVQAEVIPRRVPCPPLKTLPERSYWNKPEVVFGSSDYVARLHHMEAFYDVPGELGYIAEGVVFGFEALSFILTETQPNGGPPLHVHETEEAHVLLEGTVEYLIGERRFTVEGPYLARVPPHVPHTFANRGPCPFNLIAVFPAKKMSYEERGPNPLVQQVK